MKRSLNSSYQLVWDEVTGRCVVVSELAHAKGKRKSTLLSLTAAGVILGIASVTASASDNITTIPVGEVVHGQVISDHQSQVVFGQAIDTTVNTGLEYGEDNDDENQGGQFIQSGGQASNTVINEKGLQAILVGGIATDSQVNLGGGQSVHGQSNNTTLNGGKQWVHSGGNTRNTIINQGGFQLIKVGGNAIGTVVNTGSQGGPDAENSDGQLVRGTATDTIINANGRQVIASGALSTRTTVNAGGDQSVYGQADNSTLDGGSQYIHEGGIANNTVINQGGWQVVKKGGLANNTIANQDSKLNVSAGGTANNVSISHGAALVTTTDATLSGTNSIGRFSIDSATGTATNVLLENGGRLTVQDRDVAEATTVNQGGVLAVTSGGKAYNTTMNQGGVLIADTGATVTGTNQSGAFSIDATTRRATNLQLGQGSHFTVQLNGIAENTVVDAGGSLHVNDGGLISGTTRLNGNATLSGNVGNTGLLHFNTDDDALFNGSLTGEGQLLKEGAGRLTMSNGVVAQSEMALNQGELVLDNAVVYGNIIAKTGTQLRLTGNTTMQGAIDPTDVSLESDTTWNIVRGASVKSVIDTLDSAGTISFVTEQDKIIPETLTVKNLIGRNGTIKMFTRFDDVNFPTDKLVIDGGQATGSTWLDIHNAGNSALGMATQGEGIKVVDAINGATTTHDAFALKRKLQAGVYNYTLAHGVSDQSWYLNSEEGYRSEVGLYGSLFTQSMAYDRALSASYDQRNPLKTNAEQRAWGRIQGGRIEHDNIGGIAPGITSKSDYGFIQLGGDLLQYQNKALFLNSGLYTAAGRSEADLNHPVHLKQGDTRDNVYSVGGYMTATHLQSGLWADLVAQGARHNVKATSEMNQFDTRGWGWLTSLETGMPVKLSNTLMVEPQLQYTWQQISLDNGADNGGYIHFSDGSAQHLRAGLRFGHLLADNTEQAKSTLVNRWWIKPSVIRTFSSSGDLDMGTTMAGSNMTFSPSQNGTSVDLQLGAETLMSSTISLGLHAGYARNVSGDSTEGYNGQASLKIQF